MKNSPLLDRYKGLVSASLLTQIYEVAHSLVGVHVLHVNTTAQDGGSRKSSPTCSCAGYSWHPSARIGLGEHLMLSLAPCRFPRGRVQSQACICSSLPRGNGHCAEDCHLRHVLDTLVSSVAPPPPRHLDQTRHHLAPAGDAERPFQE